MAIYTNNDGLEVRYGSDIGKRGMRAGVTTGAGKRRELVLEVDLVKLGAGGTGFTSDLNNDGVNEAFNPSNTPLPVGAVIDQVRIVEIVAPAGGTGLVVGTYRENGTVVDDDGIAINIAGAPGAQVGTAVLQATGPWFVAAKATGTYTAGRVKVVIEFITV
jgi:hypothetical protein